MAKTPVWKSIAAALEADIAAGHYGTGDKLPTEADLAARFGVNRHTVRRALADMAARGITRSRRGAGVFVETPPTDYPIGRRVRFHKAIEATGRLPSKRVLAVTRRACDSAEASALQLSPGDPVFDYQGLSLSAGAPIAVFTSVFPAARVPDLPDALQKTSSVTQALRACGIADYIRAQTRLSAVRLDATQALHLRLREGDPALKSIGINICPEGRPIEYGLTWFAGERVTLTVTPD